MGYHVFVDNSNVWIEGKFASAVKKGFASNLIEAHKNNCDDKGWAIDFGRLLYAATDTNIQEVKNAILFGSKPTDKDSLWNAMRECGFEVRNLPRNVANKEKKVDTGIVAEILKTLYTKAVEGDVFILIMGDSDFVPVIQQIRNMKMKTTVVFWDNVSGELKAEADNYINLSPIIDKITYC